MKTNHHNWAVGVAALLLFAITAAAQSDDEAYGHSTNRFKLSLQLGLNIKASFKGIGGSLNPALNNSPGHYDDGYVLTDISGNAGGQSWNWGYDNASQVNAGNNTVSFDRTTIAANGTPSSSVSDSGSTPGFELDYNRQLWVKENWHNLRFGLDTAFSFLPLSFNNSDTFGGVGSRQTDTYSYTAGTTPPTAPYQGSFQGPGFVINVPATSSTTTAFPGATVSSQDTFRGDLWGIHLGPYVELPLGKNEQFTLSVAGGLAAGLLNARESWTQTANIPGIGLTTATGSGSSVSAVWGWYVGANADYRFTEHWGIAAGVEFQDLGIYNHTFNGREVDLDLSKSLMVLLGVSYNF